MKDTSSDDMRKNQISKGTVLVTGAKGFIGTELVKQLKHKGLRVIQVDVLDLKEDDYIKCDISSDDILKIIPENVDAIVHLAGLSRDSDCKDKMYVCFNTNVMRTIRLMEFAIQKNSKQFIFASSEWVYGETKDNELKNESSAVEVLKLNSEYALSKAVSESALRQMSISNNCSVTVCRFGIVYGPRAKPMTAVESIFLDVLNKDIVEVGSLRSGRCFIHVEDIASGIISTIGLKGFNIIGIEGEKLVTMADIIDSSKKITGKNPEVVQKNPENYNIRLISNDNILKTSDWKPKISLDAGLKTLLKK